MGGGLYSVRLVPQPDLVEVKLKDLLLGQDLLYMYGNEDFLNLSLDGFLIGKEEVPRDLLGDGAGALAYPSGVGDGHGGSRYALEIEAAVLVKALILNRDKGLLQEIRDFVDGGRLSLDLPEHPDELAVR